MFMIFIGKFGCTKIQSALSKFYNKFVQIYQSFMFIVWFNLAIPNRLTSSSSIQISLLWNTEHLSQVSLRSASLLYLQKDISKSLESA